ncbi:MAG: NlpC/P60 family protein [Lachnospiraceae bacterium]|nr:NlpC/P60 family protein [Lachnospiraceae bacterium]
MKRKILALSMAIVIGCAPMMTVHADTIEGLQQQQQQTSAQLNNTESQINNLEDQKNELTGEIDTLDAQLIETIAAINSLKDSIANKQVEIDETNVQLQAAQADKDSQYAAMKKRIQYIYEKGGDIGWATMLLEDGNISDFLSNAENTQKLYDYDKKALEAYAAVVQQVTDLGNQLETEKSDLVSMQSEQEAQQQSLEGLIEEKKATCDDYEVQIAAAEQVAAQYQDLINQQNAKIQELVEEQQRAAAAAAAQKAAEEQAAAQQQQAAAQQQATVQQQEPQQQAPAYQEPQQQAPASNDNNNNNNNNNYEDNTPQGNGGGSANVDTTPSYQEPAQDTSSGSGSSSSSNSSLGQAVIDYACQFVGNPYVWGGTSLTNGADCSGFILSVYANFGYSLPHSSAAMRGCGTGVSYSEAQPGDIICYDGHVALYMGGGAIVHASDERTGIKISGNAAYRTILAVRRIV